MAVTCVAARELSRDHLAAWSDIVRTTPALASPYFAPEFTQATAATRDDVEVAVLEDGGAPVGFLPFQRGPGRSGSPVAGRMSDFHGVVAREGVPWDGVALLRGCRLGRWTFDHLLADQQPLRRYHWATAPSPYLDLTGGFEAWRARHRAGGSREVEASIYKARKAARLVGPVRFALHTDADEAFEALLRWKSAQYRDSGVPDLTASPWVVRFLDLIRRRRGAGFQGLLSALYLGERLAAVHLGMRTPTVCHYWLPAYDPALAHASPGRVCLLELARAVASAGVVRLDLGKGEEAYKYRLASGATPVAEGAVDLNPVVAALARGGFRARAWVRRTPLRRPLLGPVRWLRRVRAAARLD